MAISVETFVKRNRKDIDRAIKSQSYGEKINDEERRLWVLNDEGLYNWALAEGVDFDK